LLLLFGSLGDLLGRKCVFVAGPVVCTLSSLLCGLAEGQGTLVGARFVQGVGGAMATGLAFLPIALTTGAEMSALTALAMSVASPDDARLASGLFNTIQQVGGALGLAILATLATSRTEGLLANGQSTASALTGGYHLAFAEIDGQEAQAARGECAWDRAGTVRAREREATGRAGPAIRAA
jgi:MFS family permease